ncbi:DUF2232 domain-containing protein [Filibacter tadaridae]|uniref:DUF2232 domain-containing protein n=1 Tax=Filibacter tadaridae TaxID=2483811 RepID=A0A3P5WQ91_9BACL|nr:DUF2232 domain-containing protein [Filibacter tadaridae]VDC21691.1 hypothetical protein FILTAD_00695 [Filibacter tadaridae]
MQDNARKITYGAMMIALFVILLAVSFYVPLIGVITMLFIPLPIILYRLRYDRALSVLVTVVGIFLSVLIGGIALVPFAFVHGLLGLVIGDTLKTGKTKLYTFMASGLALLITGMIMYVGAVLFFKFNIIEEVFENMRTAQDQVKTLMESYGGLPEGFDEAMAASFTFYEYALPSIFIIMAYLVTFTIVVPNVAIVKRLGHNVSTFQPFRNMKLPVITVILYGLLLITPYMIKMEPGTNLFLISVNATIILRFLFLLQGISFIHYYLSEMKLPKVVTVVATLLALVLSPITTILGIVDAGMNVRAWIGKGKMK